MVWEALSHYADSPPLRSNSIRHPSGLQSLVQPCSHTLQPAGPMQRTAQHDDQRTSSTSSTVIPIHSIPLLSISREKGAGRACG